MEEGSHLVDLSSSSRRPARPSTYVLRVVRLAALRTVLNTVQCSAVQCRHSRSGTCSSGS
jgi:hypothetical protein